MLLCDQYIAGFVDGEGCFALSMRKDIRHERKSKTTYFSWKASFVIALRADDSELLFAIKNHFNCGRVNFSKGSKSSARFEISDLNQLSQIVIPFFDRNPLHGKKGKDYDKWKEAVGVLMKYKNLRGSTNAIKGKRGFFEVPWEEKDKRKLIKIKKETKKFKSFRAKELIRGDLERQILN